MQEPDERTTRLFNQSLVSKKDYNDFCNFKKRSFRKEYYSVCRDVISLEACDRYRNDENILKEYEIFQARILMAHFLENFVNFKTLLKNYKQVDLNQLLKDGLEYKL